MRVGDGRGAMRELACSLAAQGGWRRARGTYTPSLTRSSPSLMRVGAERARERQRRRTTLIAWLFFVVRLVTATIGRARARVGGGATRRSAAKVFAQRGVGARATAGWRNHRPRPADETHRVGEASASTGRACASLAGTRVEEQRARDEGSVHLARSSRLMEQTRLERLSGATTCRNHPASSFICPYDPPSDVMTLGRGRNDPPLG